MVVKAESNHWINQMIDVHACGCWFVRAWPLGRDSAADFQQLASLLDVAVGPVRWSGLDGLADVRMQTNHSSV